MNENFSSGTEVVYAESNWYYSLGEAERDCIVRLDQKVFSTTQRLEREGKRTIGSTNYSIQSDERVWNDKIEYKCSGTTEINWVSIMENLKSSNKSTFSFTQNPIIVVLEDEMLNRFKKKYTQGYHSMELKNIQILKSDIKVGKKVSSLPSTYNEENYILQNCTSQVQTKNVRLTVVTTEGENYLFNRSIMTRDSTTAGLSFNVSGFNPSISQVQSRDLTISSTRGAMISRNETYQEDFSQVVNPLKALIIKIRREIINEVFILEGPILFDAKVIVTDRWKDVYACGIFGTDRCSRWKEETKTFMLSQILSEEERTFQLDGNVSISSSKNTRTTSFYVEKDANCFQDMNTEVRPFNPLNRFDFIVTDNPPLFEEFKDIKRNTVGQ